MKRVALLTMALIFGCHAEATSPIQTPSSTANTDTIAERFGDLAALYGGEHGIYRTCSPNRGVCHNNAEYPDLSNLGSILMTIGADCNRSREHAEMNDLCEPPGDVLRVGDRSYEIRSARSATQILEAALEDAGGTELVSMQYDPRLRPLYEAMEDDAFYSAVVLRTRRPVSLRPGTRVRVEGRGPLPVDEVLVVRRPHALHPRGDDVVVAGAPPPTAPDDYGFYGETLDLAGLLVGDPNDNDVFGARLRGALVVPGDPDRSYLMQRLVDPSAGPLMPRANCCTWTKQSLRALYCWIDGLSPDGSNALAPIDYAHCPPGPQEDVAYPEAGPACTSSGMCPVMPVVDVGHEANWEAVYGTLSARCGDATCHGSSAYGLDVSTELTARRTIAQYVEPGQPQRSELYRRVSPALARAAGLDPMPQDGAPLPIHDRELVRAWITGQGTPEP